MFDNMTDVSRELVQGVSAFSTAFELYHNNEYYDAMVKALDGTMNALNALQDFVNDYPYEEQVFQFVKGLKEQVSKERDMYLTKSAKLEK